MKKWLLGMAVVAVVIGGGLLWGYQHYFNRDVSEKDVHVDAGFFDFTDIVNGSAAQEHSNGLAQNGTTSINNEPEGNAKGNSMSGQTSSGQTESESSRSPGANQGNGVITEESIRAKYYPKFKQLETAALSRLDQLARNALADYKQSQKTGQPSLSDLASIYMSAANKLQAGVNQAFYQLLDQMKADLREAGLPADLAAEAEKTYKNAIEQKKNELLSYALKVKNGEK